MSYVDVWRHGSLNSHKFTIEFTEIRYQSNPSLRAFYKNVLTLFCYIYNVFDVSCIFYAQLKSDESQLEKCGLMYSTQTQAQTQTQTHKTMWWGKNRTLRKGGGCGSLYYLWQGGNRHITNDSRCLNTMSIFDGKDGRNSHLSFS